MTYTELFDLISKPWASVSDIRRIASCGRDNATMIRDNIRKQIVQDGKHLPTSKEKIIPMKNIIEYLDLNVEYISFMAKNEQSIRLQKGGK